MQTKFPFNSHNGPTAPRHGHPVLPPSRRPVKHSGRFFRAKFFSCKNERLVQCESHLELQAARFLEFAPGVLSFSEQPPALVLRIQGRRRKYTPDFVVHWADGRKWLVEVKPFELACAPEMKIKFAAARAAAELAGYHFEIVTERLTKKLGASRLEELLSIRRRSRTASLGSPREPASRTVPTLPVALAHAMARGGSAPLSELLRLLGSGPGAMNELMTLLAFRVLAWNVDQNLTTSTPIYQAKEDEDEKLFA